jgi:hypothetical protein
VIYLGENTKLLERKGCLLGIISGIWGNIYTHYCVFSKINDDYEKRKNFRHDIKIVYEDNTEFIITVNDKELKEYKKYVKRL